MQLFTNKLRNRPPFADFRVNLRTVPLAILAVNVVEEGGEQPDDPKRIVNSCSFVSIRG
jgi:hypothetical protein